ncbi:hypothetical protein [Dyadobacter fanqingshengii]|uniref:Uncharacterized protein n=1 Tax=Dyadobacter fanqingshengii TaxID=2906443 RepID=A0A9X1PE39_9BACT|nr:hypothetical protein [Dyadobacter fanqingshengii]MCF0042193.1 hypothetical protein [Dyadobacter fanqingshengii]MCF2506388.1 hypothetical protein [Dyadobacter fanqingshengii]USJ35275.1 hypothetical protein NFI81_21595 [Dyadobacter fanqingshengii]
MVKRILIFCLGIFIITSCDKDKDKPCVAPTFAKNIIGTWQGSLESSPKQTDEISFIEGGTFKESGGMLFGKRNEPVITWTAEKDSLKISGKFKNNTTAVYAFSALMNTCDSIILDVEGIDKIFLKRK